MYYNIYTIYNKITFTYLWLLIEARMNKRQRKDRFGQSTVAFESDKFSLVGKFHTPRFKVNSYAMEAAAISITANFERQNC